MLANPCVSFPKGRRANMTLTRSSIPGIVWPGIPAQAESLLMALQFQLERSQWLSPESICELQLRQLGILLRHAHQTVPYYRQVLNDADIDPAAPLTVERLRDVPLLQRDTLQDRRQELLSNNLADAHGNTFEKKTSGSTGKQIRVTDTDANRLFWMAITLRDHLWRHREFSGRLIAIRSGRSAEDPLRIKESKSWGPSTGKIYSTGPSTVLYHRMPIDQQAEVLCSKNPAYLLVYPSNAVRLAHYFLEHGLQLPGLREVMTYGEAVLPETRTACRAAWDVPVSDMYSCEELGYIALQCPRHDHYHCQSESVLVEVLDDQDRPCQPGEIGRVVLTSLHNFAMPLIRYENQDHAEVGPPCDCGRGLPVIRRVLGRRRNMLLQPAGGRVWPRLAPDVWASVAGVSDVQLIQRDAGHMEARVVRATPLDDSGERALTSALSAALGGSYEFTFRYQDDIQRHANGKYERFICEANG